MTLMVDWMFNIKYMTVQFNPLTDLGGGGELTDNSAEVLSQPFLQEAIVNSSGSYLHCTSFTSQGVLERFTQIQPKLIFSVNAVHYNGKVHPHMDKLAQVVKGVYTSVRH